MLIWNLGRFEKNFIQQFKKSKVSKIHPKIIIPLIIFAYYPIIFINLSYYGQSYIE